MTANPSQGVRIDRATNGGLRRTEAGRIALPLSVGNNGHLIGEGDLVMTHDEAVALHGELGRLLAGSLTPATDAEVSEA